MCTHRNNRFRNKWYEFLLFASMTLAIQFFGLPFTNASQINRALTDLTIVYFFEESSNLDWAAISLLSQERGCKVTLARVRKSEKFKVHRRDDLQSGLSFLDVFAPDENSFDTLFAELQANSLTPDIIIFAHRLSDPIWKEFESWLFSGKSSLATAGETSLFGLRKVYREVSKFGGESDKYGVIINRREIINRNAESIERASKLFFPEIAGPGPTRREQELFAYYELISNEILESYEEADFLSGMKTLRLIELIEITLPKSGARSNHMRLAKEFRDRFEKAHSESSRRRVNQLVAGYRSLAKLLELSTESSLVDSVSDYLRYVTSLAERARLVTLSEMGLDWKTEAIIRETPFGPAVKFKVTLSVAGPIGVELSRVMRRNIDSDSEIVIDDTPHKVRPHQQFIREYFVDYDELDVSAGNLDSLRFYLDISYGGITMRTSEVAPVSGPHRLSVAFLPGFRFIPKTTDVMVDKTFSPFYWKAVIDKPKYFSGSIRLNIKTPPGVATGSYQRIYKLTSGIERETIQFPMVAGKSMADGISRILIQIDDGRETIAIDTAIIRVAECKIGQEVHIAFLPDSMGLLEDILRMTDANFTPLTDRALEVGDLSAYHTLILGSGCHRKFPSLPKIKERLTRFVRQGGALVIFGQPEDWPPDATPLEIQEYPTTLSGKDLIVTERTHEIFSNPYAIYTRRLTQTVPPGAIASPAIIGSAKSLIMDSSNRALLAVRNMGEGKIIYCGFPLLERIAKLEINAIHLFANLLSY